MKVILVCSAGMSTSLLVRQMEKFASEGDVIEAYPQNQLEDKIDQFDVVLVGPQIRFLFDDIKKIADAHGKNATLIPIQIYGSRDGKAAMELATGTFKQ
jgi:PTS system cellobiose-specific IIB component